MKLTQLLNQLEDRHINLYLDEDKLKYQAPVNAMTSELKEAIGNQKAHIMDWLQKTGGLVPASPSQRRMWVLNSIEDPSAYNIRLPLRYQGAVDVKWFKHCLQLLFDRHAILRTAFFMDHGRLWQHQDEGAGCPFINLDFSAEKNADSQGTQYIAEKLLESYDLTAPPLWKVIHIKTGPDAGKIGFGFHHSIMDGGSLGLFSRDLGDLYRREQDPVASLPDYDYSNYIRDLKRYVAGAEGKRDLDFWVEHLQSPRPQLQLPTDYPRPRVQTHQGETLFFELNSDTTHNLKRLGGNNGATLYMVLYSLVATLFYRYTGQTDQVVGVPVSARDNERARNIYGLLLNTLPVRLSFDQHMSFTELLQRTRQTLLDAYEHQKYPLDALIEKLDLQRDTSRSPLFDVTVVMQNAAGMEIDLGDIEIQSEFSDSGTAKGDLYIDFDGTADSLRMGINYNTDLFCSERIAAMGRHFKNLAQCVITQSEQPLYELSMGNSEYAVMSNNISNEEPEAGFIELLLDVINRVDAADIALEDDQTSLNYGSLKEHIATWQSELRKNGIEEGDRVGVALGRSTNLVLAILGIWSCGAVYVPIDSSFPLQRIQHMIDSADVDHLLVEHEQRDTFAAALESVSQKVSIISPRLDGPSHAPGGNILEVVDYSPDESAYIIHTSGSTGQPKGVPITHRALSTFMRAMLARPGMSSDTRLLATTTISFDISILELFLPLLAGGTVCISKEDAISDGHTLHRMLLDKNINTLQATPSSWRLLMETQKPLPENFRAFSGGEALPADLAADLRSHCTELWNLYGPTEATIWASVSNCSDSIPVSHSITGIGQPLDNYTFGIWDEQRGFLPRGIEGELLITGNALTSGYLKREDLNRERFVECKHPSTEKKVRWYRTGDRARLMFDDAFYFYGRKDEQIKFRGFRIEPGAIETALRRIHGIDDAAVILKEPFTAEASLVAFVQKGDSTPGLDTIFDELEKTIPAYMVPTKIVFLNELPATLNGKTDRNALRNQSFQATGLLTDDAEPLQTETEIAISRIWGEVLGEEIQDRNAHFFHMGGHSLKAMQVIDRIEEEMRIKITLAHLFRYPVVCRLSRWLDKEMEKSSSKGATSNSIITLSDEERSLLEE